MKKLFSSILISFILFTNLVMPISVFAAEPTIKLGSPIENGFIDNSNGSWRFTIKTTGIPNDNNIIIELYKNDVLDSTKTENIKISNNIGDYRTGSILEPQTKYKIVASYNALLGVNTGPAPDFKVTPVYKKITDSFEKTTGGTAIPVDIPQEKTNLTDTYWFKDMDGAFRGVNGPLKLPGFATFKDCESAKKTYWVGFNSTDSTIPCSLITQEQVLANFETEKIKNAKMPGDPAVAVTPKINVAENKSIYKMLAPIGNITCMDSSGQDTNCISNDIGKYLNIIFKLAIGICAALAVIMLIIAGVSYMGDESVFGKTEAKKKMFSAVLGLIIALGAWALLNTINPALTGKEGLVIDTASVEIETQPLTSNDQYTEGTKTSQCSGGIVTAKTVNGGIPVCITLQTKIIDMVAKAKEAGINLFGYGYRSKTTQEGLRAQNCGGTANIYNTSAKCNPATAIPGNSMHENGFAVDFQCDGATIKSTDNKCYVWLKNNAPNYGYNNTVTSEPWHWSIPRN